MTDAVNHPAHYTFGKIEVLDVIEDWGLCYPLGNALKYLARAGRKDPAKAHEDLAKCQFYVRRYRSHWRDKPRKTQVPPWLGATLMHSAVSKDWNLDPFRDEILRCLFDGRGEDYVTADERLSTLITAVMAGTPKEILWLP